VADQPEHELPGSLSKERSYTLLFVNLQYTTSLDSNLPFGKSLAESSVPTVWETCIGIRYDL